MVIMADKGKGFWLRVRDGRVMTPDEFAVADETVVRFVAVPYGAIAGDDDGDDPLGAYADEEELRRLWADSVSVVSLGDDLNKRMTMMTMDF